MNAMQIMTVFECSPVQYVMKVPWTFPKVVTLFKSKRFPLLQASFNRWTIISSFLYIKQRKCRQFPWNTTVFFVLGQFETCPFGLSWDAASGTSEENRVFRTRCRTQGTSDCNSRAPPLSNTSRSAWVSLLPHVPIKVASPWFTQSLGGHFFSKQATNNFLCKHAHGQLKTGFLPLVNSKTYETRQ